jgi:hypothetical protein
MTRDLPEDLAYRLVPLKQHHTATFVTGREVVTSLVKLDGGDDVRWLVSQQV